MARDKSFRSALGLLPRRLRLARIPRLPLFMSDFCCDRGNVLLFPAFAGLSIIETRVRFVLVAQN
jgi:hypothetical protein